MFFANAKARVGERERVGRRASPPSGDSPEEVDCLSNMGSQMTGLAAVILAAVHSFVLPFQILVLGIRFLIEAGAGSLALQFGLHHGSHC